MGAITETIMKFLTALVMVAMLSTYALATPPSTLSVRGQFASLSATGIATQLPSNAANFSALAGQIGGVTVTVKRDMLDVDTISGSLVEVNGWRNNAGGIIGAVGFAGVRGMFEAD
jgi:hypothetical protein